MRISDWSSDVCSSDLFGEDQTLMRVGYARVSTSDQNPELQLDALRRAGCERVFTEKASGARDDRPELARILEDVLRAGDTLVVWKLDRLARSPRSEEHRVGKECGRPLRSRWSPFH